ncbi:MAG: helix-turn-helix domain-containing protein [Bacillota bacterium]
MDYFCFIQSVVSYIESRLKSDIDYSKLERATGFSIAHTRDVFKSCTKLSLAKYILYRRISNAAFDIIHTDNSILDIAVDYGFESYDTFTRAFKRITGYTPRDFRKNNFQVGRVKLTPGLFGPGIVKNERLNITPQLNLEEMIKMKTIKKSEDSCVLYGVPKVNYSYEECTPFPSSLRACLNYMGQNMNYSYLMAASGAAFRLRWNTNFWDGGNVDIMRIYDNPYEAFERSFKAAGREYKILRREADSSKEDFVRFIKTEIDNGRPVIALGIIGPPEACIVTGYRDNGETLLGWNFFQDNPEFAKNSQTDESGYFICSSWWENHDTKGVMSIGEDIGTETSIKELIENAVDIMTRERVGEYAGGQAAYDEWANALTDESQFPKDAILPLLFERLMCQTDAMVMISEGRAYAGCFMEWVAEKYSDMRTECLDAAKLLRTQHTLVNKIREHMGGWEHTEEQARRFADATVRKQVASVIMEVKELDARACDKLKEILNKLERIPRT